MKLEFLLQRIWRPVMMLTCIGIIFNNYVLAPYLAAIFGCNVAVELPSGLWALMNVGVGTFVVGRTVEKIKGIGQSILPLFGKNEETVG